MSRKLRIVGICLVAVTALVLAALAGAYFAAQQVRPFYAQALQVEAATLEAGSNELESRATALYSDARQAGKWNAVFTADQINGWLATQLTEKRFRDVPDGIRDPRVAITPDLLTLGFRTSAGGVETVASVDAAVFLTDDGQVAIRLICVRAGAIPLPAMQVADELAAACCKLSLPVRWTQEGGQPVALIELHTASSNDKRQFHIDAIELAEGQVYVAGHTQLRGAEQVELSEYELRLSPRGGTSALEVARRADRPAGTPTGESTPLDD